MNCEKCQDLLSDFLEGTIDGQDTALFNAHLEECLCCADVREELHSIVNVAREVHDLDVAPPNARALWVRIRNSVEIELEANRAAAARSTAGSASSHAGFWANLMNKRWELSLPQLTTAIATLVFVVVTVTMVGVQGWRSTDMASGESSTNSVRGAGSFDAAADALYHQTYLQQQETRMNYWRQRVEARKASWNPQMRNSYETSINAFDQAIGQALGALQRDPHDEIAQELLNSALRGKMEFLREFSDQ